MKARCREESGCQTSCHYLTSEFLQQGQVLVPGSSFHQDELSSGRGLSPHANWLLGHPLYQHRPGQTFEIPLRFHLEALLPVNEIVENTDNLTD